MASSFCFYNRVGQRVLSPSLRREWRRNKGNHDVPNSDLRGAREALKNEEARLPVSFPFPMRLREALDLSDVYLGGSLARHTEAMPRMKGIKETNS